jgi:succinyl-diaminopimelate desuccinylase
MTPVAQLLADLIRLPSVNPMGQDVSGPEYLEQRVSDYLQAWFQRLGVPFERVEVAPGRANLLARLDGTPGAPTVMLDAHQDTVPITGMVIPPFEPTVSGGRMSGRGSCDVKGGLAAMLTAFEQLVRHRPARHATVVMSCTCDEESTCIGINHLTSSWQGEAPRYRLLPQKPDVALVAEPTMLHAVVAHRGAVRWRMRTTGRACHSSRPQDGINAIYRMAKVVSALETYAEQLSATCVPHRLCGPATLSVGIIQGGTGVNVVPDSCQIEIDRRVIPGEDRARVIPAVQEYLREAVPFELQYDPPYIDVPALGDELNHEWADRWLQVVEPVCGPREKQGVPYGTHASRIARVGVPAVVVGPGDIAQAHTKDEWIELSQLDLAVQAYVDFCVAAADSPR